MKRTAILLLLCACAPLGCSSDKPEDLLPEPVYEKLLLEMRMLSEYRMATSDSLLTSRLADSIFRSSDVSADRFYRSHAWYELDPSNHAARLGRLADSLSTLDTRLSTPVLALPTAGTD
jgi:hypothetical protein